MIKNGEAKRGKQLVDTSCFDNFEFILGNRLTDRSHIEELKTSFMRHPYLTRVVRTTTKGENGKYKVLDGQNTLIACQELCEQFPGKYFISQLIEESQGIDDVIVLNVTQRKWGRVNYIYSYVARNQPNYVSIIELQRMYPMLKHVYILVCLLNTTYVDDVGKNNKDLKNGKFEVASWQKAQQLAGWLITIIDTVRPKDRIIPRLYKFQLACVKMFTHPEYIQNRFVKRLNSNLDKIYRAGEVKDYLAIFSAIYNCRISDMMEPVYFERMETYGKMV